MESSRTYRVAGMTCGHCRTAVAGEVGAIPGVRAVEVDLAAGRIRVVGHDVADEQVVAAVAAAGYEVLR
ncbi:MAG TPA: cation transporter [Miltoncostaeaceae bacterium]|nr:cation transporter [Miltoncostaeaceae bacterium]